LIVERKHGDKKMNNKKGGFGAKLVLVLILMIASAVGGAYGYRIFDGKMAIRDAQKAIEDVDVSDYDEPEQVVINNYIEDAKKDLEKVQTRQEVYEVLAEFISDVDKVQTKNEKALEEALKAAEEAKNQKNNSNNSNNNNSVIGNNSGNSNDSTYNYDSNSDSDSGSYKSNQLNDASDGTEGSSSGGGILDSLLGSMKGN
jgi:hypothetical protein